MISKIKNLKKSIKINDEEIIQKSINFSLNFSYSKNINIKNINKFDSIIQKNQNKTEIISFINIKCDLQEIINIYYTSKDDVYSLTMNDIYKKKFINGKVLHKIPNDNEYIMENGNQITVKKSYFKGSKLFNKMNEWCYIENYIQYDNTIKISFVTLNEGGNICNLIGIITIDLWYKHNLLYNNKTLYNITFQGYTINNSKLSIKYLKLIANSLQQLPEIINKNRISLQTPANLTLCNVNNSHCISCLKQLKCFKILRRRCSLCSLYICNKCTNYRNIRALDTYNSTINICVRCINCINRCDYSNIKFYNNQSFARIIMDSPNEENAYHRLKKYLIKKSNDPVIFELYNDIIEDNTESFHKFRKFSNEFREEDSLCFDITNDLDNCFDITLPSPDSCELLSSRSYALTNSSYSNTLNDIIEPFPTNELERTEYLNNLDINRLRNIKELNIICDIINEELDCFYIAISLIKTDTVYAIASNVIAFNTDYPRKHGMCQHTIMDKVPLLINNPSADVRYNNIKSIPETNIKFYFGIPLFSSTGLVLGTLCCVDNKVREITVSQYSLLLKLSKIATKHIEYEYNNNNI